MSKLHTFNNAYEYIDDSEVVKSSNEFVNYGANNDYPSYLIELYQKSSVHNALCNSIASWIYGDGVTSPDKDEKVEAWAKFLQLFDRGIGKNTIQKCVLDLKVQGGFYLSISYSLDRTTITEVEHIPFENMRSGEENDGEVDFYYYSKDWSNKKSEREKIKSFDPEQKQVFPNQIACFKMYSVGSYYYPKPDYQGGINYINLDKNVSEYHLANIQNGLAPSFLLSFNQGIPSEEKRREVKRQIEDELSGSKNAGKFILSFSDDRNNAPEITSFALSDADKQYEFLSKEITSKVMVSHRVVSPRLFGVNSDGGGLGNNADELKTASVLFEQTVVNGYRELLTEAFELIMFEAGEGIKLEFESAQPFTEEQAEEQIIEETDNELDTPLTDPLADEKSTDEAVDDVAASYNGAQISSAIDIIAKVQEGILTEEQAVVFLIQFLQLPPDVAKGFFNSTELSLSLSKLKKKDTLELTDDDAKIWLDYLDKVGEVVNLEGWELIEETDVDDVQIEANLHAAPFEFFKRYASPDDKSKTDKGLYKVRYRYSRNIASNSRLFCRNMVSNAKLGVSYRYEDVIQMGKDGINGEFAPHGKSTYSIWEWKGGVYCHHKFIRQVWKRKRNASGQFLPNDGLKNDTEVSSNTRGTGITNPRGWRKSSTPTIDLPNRGSLKHKGK
jgi:hypothetical protein